MDWNILMFSIKNCFLKDKQIVDFRNILSFSFAVKEAAFHPGVHYVAKWLLAGPGLCWDKATPTPRLQV